MSPTPNISIITVTYNAAQYLEKTIWSITSQSYPNIEYLIIDGGSTDGTVDIIEQYADRIAYWCSEPDKGLYDAMNKGLRRASGDYVWFINAGDLIHTPDTVERIVVQLTGDELPDVIYGETAIIDGEGRNLGLRRLRAPRTLTWKRFRMGMLVCHQSFIVRREITPEYDLRYRFSADYDWAIKCLKNAKFIFYSGMILSDFLEEGMTSQNRKKSLRERYEIMCNHYGKISTSLLHAWFAIRFYSSKLFRGRV